MFGDTVVKIFTNKDVFVGEFDGITTTEQLLSSGVPYSRIRKYIEDGFLIRLERGVYTTPDSMDDEWVFLQSRYRKGIFSGYTALYLQNMADNIPAEFHMTFPHGYNARSIGENEYRIVPSYAIPKLYSLGVCDVKTPYGNTVRAYDRERTLCDMVRGSNIDVETVKQAMRSYVRSDGMNIRKLTEYAEELNVRPRIHRFLEVML